MDSIRISKVEDVTCTKAGSSSVGTVHLTAHHIIFRYTKEDTPELWMPYPLMLLVTRLPQTLEGKSPVMFHTRTFESFCLSFSNDIEASDVFESVRDLTVTTSVEKLYAFFYVPSPPLPTNTGWKLYSPREEFGRMGLGTRTKAWRFTDINKDYEFCPTYPAKMVVPTRISDTTLQYASKFRSKARIPVLSYVHWGNFASITRCSQPMSGITQNRSIQDEKLIEAIFQSHLNPESRASTGNVYGATTTNLIVDARPTANAVANTAKGAGSEIMDNYKDCKKVYLGIDNINVMRDSLGKVVDALREADSLIVGLSNDLEQDMSGLPVLDRMALRRSGWLRHLRAILEGTLLMVKNVHVNSSHILVHCSDGWDRTAQLSSLAQICLDPYFRTIHGLQVLVEKEWLSYGHKFNDRCGHLSSESYFVSPADLDGNGRATDALLSFVQTRFASNGHLKETSPVFHQFLECLWNVKRQFPTRFEYNDYFLKQLYYHLYSCQFGTFLYNCERERRHKEDGKQVPVEATLSLWDFLNSPEEMEKSKNETYDTSLDDPLNRESGADMGVLFPNTSDIRFWYGLYRRTDEEMNGRLVKPQPKAPEVVGTIKTAAEDPVVPTPLDQASVPLPPSPSPSPSPALSQTPRSRSPPVTSPTARASSPLRREDSPNANPILSNVPGFTSRPWSSSLSNLSSTKQRGTGSDYLSNAGVKSIWGKLSSNASAAFSVVQDAYTNVSKDYLPQESSSSSRSQELQSRDSTSVWGEGPSGSTNPFQTNTRGSGSSASSPSRKQTSDGNRAPMSYLPADNPWSSMRSPGSSSSSPSLGSLFPDDPTVAHPSQATASPPAQHKPTDPQTSTTTTPATSDGSTKQKTNELVAPNDDADPLGVWAS